VLARLICGEGMPNFYAKQVLATDKVTCVGPDIDIILKRLLGPFGVCKPFDKYNLKKDADGNPLISEC
jgi:hypothetical protein